MPSREYRLKHLDKIHQQSREYYQRNKDKIKQYYFNNKERLTIYKSQWYQNNKEERKIRAKIRYENNKESIFEKQKIYNMKNKELINAIKRKSAKKTGIGQKRIVYRGRKVSLLHNPRTGICALCKSKVGNEIKITNMHHMQYDDTDVLAHTIELCAGCHQSVHAINRLIKNAKESGMPLSEIIPGIEQLHSNSVDVSQNIWVDRANTAWTWNHTTT